MRFSSKATAFAPAAKCLGCPERGTIASCKGRKSRPAARGRQAHVQQMALHWSCYDYRRVIKELHR